LLHDVIVADKSTTATAKNVKYFFILNFILMTLYIDAKKPKTLHALLLFFAKNYILTALIARNPSVFSWEDF